LIQSLSYISMTLQQLLDDQFKVKTRANENPVVAAIGLTEIQVLANNPNRLAWILINLSANTIYLALSRGVGATRGITVTGNGGIASMMWNEDFQMTGYEVFGIATGAASAIYVLEVVTAE